MRINKFVAMATGLSRRAADTAIAAQRIQINNQLARSGDQVANSDTVTLDGVAIIPPHSLTTIMLNKPPGYVCSRVGQGSQTIYRLLPAKFHHLKPVGRLDKDSSGLLILTDDGMLAQHLTHPRYAKRKIYIILLDKVLQPDHQHKLSGVGIQLEDGPSKLSLKSLMNHGRSWQVTMHEGRNRQIRRTFAAVGYHVQELHRTEFGPYKLGALKEAGYQIIGQEKAKH